MVWKLKLPFPWLVMVPSGTLPDAFKTAMVACGFVLVALTFSNWADFENVAVNT